MTSPDAVDPIRQAWQAAHVTPLWENAAVHKVGRQHPRAQLWTWRSLVPLIEDAIGRKSLQAVERRVLSLCNQAPRFAGDVATTTHLQAALQILMPGEAARPHRHTPNALRFVLDGGGAATIVDGKSCAMSEGDLVITPAWCWHEHIHRGQKPIIWLDALDAPFHRYLGTDVFEPGPHHDLPPTVDDDAFANATLVPEGVSVVGAHSPVFRYPWAVAAAALAAAPPARDGARRVRYVNPLTGGPAMALLDCYLTEIGHAAETIPFRSTSDAICTVVAGHGYSQVGEDRIEWGPKDIFTLPHGNWSRHRAADAPATLFVVTDREILRRLDLLRDVYGEAGS